MHFSRQLVITVLFYPIKHLTYHCSRCEYQTGPLCILCWGTRLGFLPSLPSIHTLHHLMTKSFWEEQLHFYFDINNWLFAKTRQFTNFRFSYQLYKVGLLINRTCGENNFLLSIKLPMRFSYFRTDEHVVSTQENSTGSFQLTLPSITWLQLVAFLSFCLMVYQPS